MNLRLVLWLCIGSVPAAFCGVFLIRALPHREQLDAFLRKILGIALLLAAVGLVVRAVLQMLRRRTALGEGPAFVTKPPEVVVRRVPTVILGALAGLLVGMTSVGAGSVIIVILLLMHPGAARVRTRGHRPGPGRAARRRRPRSAICSTGTSRSGWPSRC